MQLTIVVSSTQRRGAEVFASQLAESLPGRGWEVDFVALADRPPEVNSSVPAQPLSDRTPATLGRLDVDVARALRSRLKQRTPHVVLANGSSTLQYGVAATRSLPKRPMIAYSSIGEPLYWAGDPRRRVTYRLLLTLVDAVFSVSSGTARQLVDRLGVPEDKLTVLPTGVPERFLDIAIAEHHGGPLRILHAGSLSAEKDPLAAVAVMKRVVDVVPAVMRMAGSGPLEDAVRRSVSEGGMAQAIEMVGSVSDVTALLEWADVVLLTSRTEGLPGIVLEASAAGRPVVAFDVGGVSEAVRTGVSGVLVGPGDVSSAAAELALLAADPDRRSSMGAAGRVLIRERFTMEAAIDRYDRALRATVGRGHRQ